MVAQEDGEGAAVVLLHGQPGDARDWDRVVAALDGRVRSIVPDRPGYGKTGGNAGTIAANADAVCEMLDRCGVQRATIVGYSWGGAITLELAQHHPDRVGGVVLVSAVGGAGSIDDLDRLLAARVVGPALSLGGLIALRAERIRRYLVPSEPIADPAAVDRLPDGWLRSWRSFVVEERALIQELPAITSRLVRIDGRAVALIGTADRVVRPHTQRDPAARIGVEVVAAPGRGHLLAIEVPELVADVIVRVATPASDNPDGPETKYH
ncbi:MAG: alpha/beta fold hydrolase [Acidimicrobiales bacterium]